MRNAIDDFTDLIAWKKAHKLVLAIYNITKTFPKPELYALTSQLRRAASSITANIAEGYARFYFKEKIRFYLNTRGSAAEVQNFLLLAKDLEYINENEAITLVDEVIEIRKIISGLIGSLHKKLSQSLFAIYYSL